MRILVLAGFFILLFGVVVARLWYLQIEQYEHYTQKVLNQQLRDTTITANRGTIYDANMKVLASSATVWNIVVSPASLHDQKSAEKTQANINAMADVLCEVLEDVDRTTLLEKLSN